MGLVTAQTNLWNNQMSTKGGAVVGYDNQAIIWNIWAEFLAQILIMGKFYIETI